MLSDCSAPPSTTWIAEQPDSHKNACDDSYILIHRIKCSIGSHLPTQGLHIHLNSRQKQADPSAILFPKATADKRTVKALGELGDDGLLAFPLRLRRSKLCPPQFCCLPNPRSRSRRHYPFLLANPFTLSSSPRPRTFIAERTASNW